MTIWLTPVALARSTTITRSVSNSGASRWQWLSIHMPVRPSAEDHGPVAVHQHPVLGMPLDRARQGHALDIAAHGHELLGRQAVVDAGDLLLDDGSFVQVRGHVMGGGADQLDTALIGLVIGLGALEAGQEAVVDVDGPAREVVAQARTQDLHIARQHHQIDLVLFDHLDDLALLRGLLLLAGIQQREVVEGDVVRGGQLVEVAVVADDGRDLNGQMAGLHTEQQVVEAMAQLGDQQQHAGLGLAVHQLPVHLQARGQGAEGAAHGSHLGRGFEGDAHEEALMVGIAMLGRGQDIAPLLQQETGHRMDDAGLVRAAELEDEARGLGRGHDWTQERGNRGRNQAWMLPPTRLSWVWHCAASCWSWVTITKAVPCSRAWPSISSNTAWAVPRSRLPVGSSASTQAGWVTRARAMATRWRSPPESSLGRCSTRSARPTRASTHVLCVDT
eukprot:Opistho-1_new@79202